MGFSVDGSPWGLLGLAGVLSEPEGRDTICHISGFGLETDITVFTLYQ